MDRQQAILVRLSLIGRLVGLGGIILLTALWVATDRLEPALLGAFGSLWAIGEGSAAMKGL